MIFDSFIITSSTTNYTITSLPLLISSLVFRSIIVNGMDSFISIVSRRTRDRDLLLFLLFFFGIRLLDCKSMDVVLLLVIFVC